MFSSNDENNNNNNNMYSWEQHIQKWNQQVFQSKCVSNQSLTNVYKVTHLSILWPKLLYNFV